ncbi:MAG: diacylglycerol kinase family protein [Bacteroidales bacterium]|nr:diacylglycerol kinase family protein [Bacteroidales bacterium]
MNKTYIKKRIQSFVYAFAGIFYMLKKEPNAIIHIVLMFLAIAFGIFLNITKTEWCILAIAAAMVLASEAFNTAIEQLVDLSTQEYNEKAGMAKDLAAGAVLITAGAAAIAGIVIFIPKIIERVGQFI